MGRKKLQKMKVADGKVHTEGNFSSLDQMLGITPENQLSVASIEEYESKLREMSKYELESHAIKLAVIPRDDRDFLIKQLLREYSLSTARYKGSFVQSKVKSKLSDAELKKLLS